PFSLAALYVATWYVMPAFPPSRNASADPPQPLPRLGTRTSDRPDVRDDMGGVLYGANCAGCHGADGRGGAARGLADPVFLQIAGDATIRHVTAAGVPGTAMPAFAKSAGGTLTDQQIDSIVSGMRSRWGTVNRGSDVIPPPYSTSSAGDARRGAEVYATFCSACHGADGRGGPRASRIVAASCL